MHTELESPVAGHCREIGSGTLSLTVTHGSSGTSGNSGDRGSDKREPCSFAIRITQRCTD